jgi:predicted ATPase
MRYIEKIQIKPWKCFKEEIDFETKSINLIVGDQGCGKSTLLSGLQENKIQLKLSEECLQKGVSSFYFDSEKMNPRVVDAIKYTNADGTSKGIGMGSAIQSRFQSHGEVLVEFTVSALRKASNCIIFLDEPESGLSLRNQYNLAKEVLAASERGCQLFIATHCLILIQSVQEVLSLEHGKWMSVSTFVEANQE